MQIKCKYFSLVSDLANTGAGIQRKRTLAKSLRDSFRRLKSRRGSRKKKADDSAASPGSARSPERYIMLGPKSWSNLTKRTRTFFFLGLLVFVVLMSWGIFGGKKLRFVFCKVFMKSYRKIFAQN